MSRRRDLNDYFKEVMREWNILDTVDLDELTAEFNQVMDEAQRRQAVRAVEAAMLTAVNQQERAAHILTTWTLPAREAMLAWLAVNPLE